VRVSVFFFFFQFCHDSRLELKGSDAQQRFFLRRLKPSFFGMVLPADIPMRAARDRSAIRKNLRLFGMPFLMQGPPRGSS